MVPKSIFLNLRLYVIHFISVVLLAVFMDRHICTVGCQSLRLFNFVHFLQFFFAQTVNYGCPDGVSQNVDCRSESV